MFGCMSSSNREVILRKLNIYPESFFVKKENRYIIESKTKFDCLKEMVRFLPDTLNKQEIFQNLLKREEFCSTGIGCKIAVPHTYDHFADDFILLLGECLYPIEWGAIDKNTVRYVFLIIGPCNRQAEWLQYLSKTTESIVKEKCLYNQNWGIHAF
jgi:PTS system nitrogen regulatory IIA component